MREGRSAVFFDCQGIADVGNNRLGGEILEPQTKCVAGNYFFIPCEVRYVFT